MPRDIELVLLEQLSSCLAIPMLIAGPEGNLLFFNESAEPLVGLRFEESGELSLQEWGEILYLTDENGDRLSDDERPLIAALRLREPVHRTLFVRSLDGETREIEATGIPLLGIEGNLLGALGLLWEKGYVGPIRAEAPPQLRTRPRPRNQHEVEAILVRRLASYLATPIYLVGAEGRLIYCNEAAERVLGRSLAEMLQFTRDEMYATFRPTALDGSPLDRGKHPMTQVRKRGGPAHLRFCHITDGVVCTIEGTAFPLIGQSGRIMGAVGIFWEIDKS